MVVNMSPIPTKIIGKKAYLQVKGPSGLSKDLEPKRHPNT
jgi:hypothetical protein